MENDRGSFISAILAARSPEVWVALFACALYVYRKSENPVRWVRVVEAGISAMLGFSVGPDAAAWAGINDVIAAALVGSLGYLVLDFMTSILRDREALKELLRLWLGAKRDGK